MRVSPRSLVVVAAAALVATALAPAAPAAAHHPKHDGYVLSVSDASAYEYRKTCDRQAPYDCRTDSTQVVIILNVETSEDTAPEPTEPFTVDFLIEDITAVHGVNYTGPTSGTATVEPRYSMAQHYFLIPVLDTGGDGEPDKTFRLSLTGTSLPNADLSDTGIGTIRSGGLIPRDCDPFRPDGLTISMTCTDRPADDQWTVRAQCQWEGGGFPFWKDVDGPIVTGNGTTSASCTEPNFMRFSGWSFRSLD